jgi:hypothetical protein
MSDHYTRDFVWLTVTDNSFNLPFDKIKSLGITGLYLPASDTLTRYNACRAAGFRVGVFYPASTTQLDGPTVALHVNESRLRLALNDGGATPFLLDFEPSAGSSQFWKEFLWGTRQEQDSGSWVRGYRGTGGYNNGGGYMPGRVTDFTPEPFKGTSLPCSDLIAARLDAKVQYYFGDMSPVDGGEARDDLQTGLNGVGFPREAVRGFVDGGRRIPPPILYEGRVVRRLQGGTCVWNANLCREAGLI